MRSDERFEGLTAFLTVAHRRSFRAAAKELGVTPGAVSQTIRALEQRVGHPLFVRTTRSVAMTEEGQALLAKVAPAAAAIDDALAAIGAARKGPTGHLRLSVPRLAVPLFVTPVLRRFHDLYPDVSVEISVEDALVDLQESGCDAGIRIGDSIAKDMVAIRLSPEIRWCVVGAPSYFAEFGHPGAPRDLLGHSTIRYRSPGTKILYRWELQDEGRPCAVDVPGPFTVNDGMLGLELARQGLGLLYTADISVANELADGTLQTTLDACSTTSPGCFLYFPAGAQHQPKLRAFADTVREFVAGKAAVTRKRGARSR
ncbi:Transcriptional regulator, LysR family [Labilithrix luteola]|uniref:Transcriptional regulator, LysR family n=1 Tax=Labilithrix luteola TaxID=1391654 RepID=A0A0K1PPM7_9BACT|nr:LysR family transcriptional regulator [Labilithrix luteola]AKU95495.1 Transcriptional regulator, LysR family [Labilithrix luteola]